MHLRVDHVGAGDLRKGGHLGDVHISHCASLAGTGLCAFCLQHQSHSSKSTRCRLCSRILWYCTKQHEGCSAHDNGWQ